MTKSKLERALELAATVHLPQKRKGTQIPYIVHPVSVMLIASKATQDENILCACLLHDVLEDGDPTRYNESDMLRDFGPEVTSAVKSVSKDETIKDWKTRNTAYINTLRASNNADALTVCAADKIHNLRSILADYDELGDDLWSRFNAGKDQQKWWYRSVLALLEELTPESILTKELKELVAILEEL